MKIQDKADRALEMMQEWTLVVWVVGKALWRLFKKIATIN
jgi:hypothetical protein